MVNIRRWAPLAGLAIAAAVALWASGISNGAGAVSVTTIGGGGLIQFAGTADLTVNGAGETSIVPTGAGSVTLPANFWATAGSAMRLRVYGLMNTNATPGTVTWNVKLDGVIRMGGGAQNLTISGAGGKYYLDIIATARSAGAGGSINLEGWGQYITTSPTAPAVYTMQQDNQAVDTTVSHVLDLTINFSQNVTSQWVTKSFIVSQL